MQPPLRFEKQPNNKPTTKGWRTVSYGSRRLHYRSFFHHRLVVILQGKLSAIKVSKRYRGRDSIITDAKRMNSWQQESKNLVASGNRKIKELQEACNQSLFNRCDRLSENFCSIEMIQYGCKVCVGVWSSRITWPFLTWELFRILCCLNYCDTRNAFEVLPCEINKKVPTSSRCVAPHRTLMRSVASRFVVKIASCLRLKFSISKSTPRKVYGSPRMVRSMKPKRCLLLRWSVSKTCGMRQIRKFLETCESNSHMFVSTTAPLPAFHIPRLVPM